MKNKIENKSKLVFFKIGGAMLAISMMFTVACPSAIFIVHAKSIKKSVTKTKKKKSYKAKAGTVNLKAITLTKGKSKTISVKSKSKVAWKTSNKSVVSVKSIGKSKVKITAKKEGSANVTGKAKSAKWNVKVKVKGWKPIPTPSGKKSNFYFKINSEPSRLPNTIRFFWPGIATYPRDENGLSSYKNDSVDIEGSSHSDISATVEDNSKVKCISSDPSVLKVVKPDLSHYDPCYVFFNLIPYKAGTVTLTMTYPGGEYKKKVTVKPSAVYEKIKNFVPAVKNSGLDDAHKAFVLAAWMYKNTTYGYNKSEGLYGFFVEGKGVCEDYARAYEWLANLVGLDCHYTKSTIHAWNQVKLNGKWYNIDATGSRSKDEDYYYEVFSGFSSDKELLNKPCKEYYSGPLSSSHVPATSTYYDEGDASNSDYWANSQKKQEKWNALN